MSFLLCCFLGNKNKPEIDIEKNAVYKRKISPQTECKKYSLRDEIKPVNTKNIRRLSKEDLLYVTGVNKEDTLIQITHFEKSQYWFRELIKYCIPFYNECSNKKELFEHLWRGTSNINNILDKYKEYYLQFGENINKDNLILFYNDPNNKDFITDIRISANIYRFH